jgi:peptidoglycan-associated lipoprotein
MKKFIFALALLMLAGSIAYAQPINRATPDAMFKAAEEAEAAGNIYAALELYEEVYDDNKDKALAVKVAKLNYDLRDYATAEKWFSRLILRDRKGEYTELKYYYAMSMKGTGKHAEAIEMFNQYIAEGSDAKLKADAKREIAGSEAARKAKAADNLIIADPGKKINAEHTDGSPSYGGGELFFASMRPKEKGVVVLDGKEGDDWYSRIYTAARTGTEFGEAAALNTEINREGYHQGNVSVSADGKTMFFTRVELENMVMKTSKICVAKKASDGWGAVTELVGVNGEYIARHPSEGELYGEKVLFFSANIPGGKGGYDLYYAPRKTDNVYGLPVALEALNTPGEEASPYYRDGKLYYSTNGLTTFGGMDVFMSEWNGAVWSAPTNIGMGVNSAQDDLYYTQASDGMSGFFVSNRPNPINKLKNPTCCDNIYTWEIERVKVNLVANTFRMKRKSEKEAPALNECTVQVIDVTDKKPTNTDQKTQPTSNKFEFTLQPEKSYMVIATRDGFIADTSVFNTVGVKKSKTVEQRLVLRSVKKVDEVVYDTIRTNEAIRLDNILYDYDKWDIRPDAEPDLQYLTDILAKYPDMVVELSSHTDARGKDAYNLDLSQKRAQSAVNWIVGRGISPKQLVAKGYGETMLVNGCSNGVECSEEEHQLNRRTEFKIISGPTYIVTERIEKKIIPGGSTPASGGDKKPGTTKPGGQKPGGKQSVREPLFFYQD